jgi:hypothetical protein
LIIGGCILKKWLHFLKFADIFTLFEQEKQALRESSFRGVGIVGSGSQRNNYGHPALFP